MPIVKSLMSSLTTRYGAHQGERVYHAMVAEASGPFRKGAKHHDEHVAFAQKLGMKPIERERAPKSKGSKMPHHRRRSKTAMGQKRQR